MKTGSKSLRIRLIQLILLPLIVIALLLGYWRYSVAKETAEILFDRSLLATALAISRDVEISGGDSLSLTTRDLMRDAASAPVFYHVTGPGGIYVTGYAYPPVSTAPAMRTGDERYQPQYFNATYRDDSVRVLRLSEPTSFEGVTGDSIVTVWQTSRSRLDFARQLAARTASVLGVLLATLCVVVGFAVHRGLQPLLDLEDAISRRSPNDLSEIQRAVPREVKSVVSTLNRLLTQLRTSISDHQAFISDAAHQLRNPAAAVLSMAEAAQQAQNSQDRAQRVDQLVVAARESSRVTEQLLSLDRLHRPAEQVIRQPTEFGALVQSVCSETAGQILDRGIAFEFQPAEQSLWVAVDSLLVAEAIKNLIDNAVTHGGESMTAITVSLARVYQLAAVTVYDNGKTLRAADQSVAFSRFGQLESSQGSGLGLAIAQTVAQRHNGDLRINSVDTGASITLSLPMVSGESDDGEILPQ